MTFISLPSTGIRRVIDGQSTRIQVASSPSAYVGSGPGRSSAFWACVATRRRMRGRSSGIRGYRTNAVRIAIDIDSTLPHYWDLLSAAAERRFGVTLPHEDQVTWGITLLRPEQVRACVEETHTDERVLAAEPYPGAVEVVSRWHAAGHFIHITSHRQDHCSSATRTWLRRSALPFDEL